MTFKEGLSQGQHAWSERHERLPERRNVESCVRDRARDVNEESDESCRQQAKA